MLAFHEHDQKLFNDWYELTFRPEKKKTEKLREELRALVRFHNWVVATARLQDITMPEAYRLMDQERERYENGDAETRRQIDEKRRKRERAMHEDMERDAEKERSSARKEAAEINEIRDMSEIKLNKLCSDPETAFELLEKTLSLSRTAEGFGLFLKVWKATSPRIQRDFARAFKHENGVSLEKLIEKVQAALQEDEEPASQDDSDGETETDSAADLSDEADSQSAKRGTRGRFSPQGEFDLNDKASAAPTLEERLKLMYRKLVGRLHPDLHGEMKPWQKKIWDRAQKAYADKNHDLVERLYKLTMLRLQELRDLTMSEIHESYAWLKSEFSELNREAKNLKRMPAWGFSKRKNYEPLTKKILRDFDRDFSIVLSEIEEIQNQHQILESMYYAEAFPERPRTRHGSRSRQRRSERHF